MAKFGAHVLPPVTSPEWKDNALPLLEYISTPKTWPELNQWAKDSKMLPHVMRNLLAWCEGSHRAWFHAEKLQWCARRGACAQLRRELKK